VTSLAIFVIAIALTLLWASLVAPAILRAFGLPVAYGKRWLDHRHLSRTQYVWACGVFEWGLGMFLFFIVYRYLKGRLLGDRFLYPSPTNFVVGLLIWIAAGWVFGVISARNRHSADQADR
jgi:hypothetical protein